MYRTLAYVNLLHSGTGFVLGSLFRGNWVRMDVEGASIGAWPVAFSHFWLSNYDWLDAQLPRYAGVITSTRAGLEASWRKRRPWAFSDLEPEREAFATLMRKHDGLVIDLDNASQRQAALDEINQRYGLALSTDWQPIASMQDGNVKSAEEGMDINLRAVA